MPTPGRSAWVGAFGGDAGFLRAKTWIDFIGNKNVALIIGAVLSLRLLKRQRGLSLAKISDLTGPPLETAGVIILITSAGGAFGYMLTQAGVGDALAGWAEEHAGHQSRAAGLPRLTRVPRGTGLGDGGHADDLRHVHRITAEPWLPSALSCFSPSDLAPRAFHG